MLAEKRWQKWDAIKHFICVIEFLWIIVHKKKNSPHSNHYNENKKHVFVAKEDEKNATHFTNEEHYSMHCQSAVLICIFIYFRSVFLCPSLSTDRSPARSFLSLRIHNDAASNIFRVLFTSPLFISLSFLFNLSKLQKHDAKRVQNKNVTYSKCRINFGFDQIEFCPFLRTHGKPDCLHRR